MRRYEPKPWDIRRCDMIHADEGEYVLYCDAQTEIERLQTIIGNLHAVEEKHRETANAEFHRANRLQVEKGRLRGLLAEAIQWNWNDFEEAPTESSAACLPLLVDLHQRIKSALAQKGASDGWGGLRSCGHRPTPAS